MQTEIITKPTIKRILITGSSGTIGTRLAERLLDEGAEITGVDRQPSRWLEAMQRQTLIGDLCDISFVQTLPADIDLVVHLAANARVFNLVQNPDEARDNILSVYNTLEYCRKNGIKRFILASSREVYGNTDTVIHGENDASIRHCESPYTASKIAAEAMVSAYARCYGINFIILRFSNVYGCYDLSDRFIPLAIRKTLARQTMEIFGEEKLLDFTYIDDTIQGILRSIQQFDEVENETFNIASGLGSSLVAVVKLIQAALDIDIPLTIAANRQPTTDITTGISRAVDWYLNRGQDAD
jgi:UDP-glucose 4-epimerase